MQKARYWCWSHRFPRKQRLEHHVEREVVDFRFWSNPFSTQIALSIFWKHSSTGERPFNPFFLSALVIINTAIILCSTAQFQSNQQQSDITASAIQINSIKWLVHEGSRVAVVSHPSMLLILIFPLVIFLAVEFHCNTLLCISGVQLQQCRV